MIPIESEYGIVISNSGSKTVVRLAEVEACLLCNVKLFCRVGNIGENEILVRNELNAKTGSRVLLAEQSKLVYIMAIMQFGLPLAGLLLGIFFGNFFQVSFFDFPNELNMSLIGFTGLMVGGSLTWIWSKRKASTISPAFKIISVLPLD